METFGERMDFQNRLKSIEELKNMGINPYPHKYNISHTISEILRENIDEIKQIQTISTAGRVMAIRRHGRLSFADIWDEGVKLQCCFRADILGLDRYEFFKRYIGRGDFIGVCGQLFYTKTGELTLEVKDFTILAKALYELPSRYGLRDIEKRYRLRSLDFLLNSKARKTMIIRAKTIAEIRNFLNEKGYLEIETPIIQPVYGGANAKPFRVHVNALGIDEYLRISPELYLKRMIMGGFNRVYEIGKNFRNEDIDATHNPEFTTLEVYQAYADYYDMMKLTEELITTVIENVLGTLTVKFGEYEIDFTPPWKRIRLFDALREEGLDVDSMSDKEIQKILIEHNKRIPGGYNRGLAIEKLFEIFCEHKLIQPTFVIDYPKETSPLCKLHRNNPALIERFELYIAGMEIANSYTELNDPILQHEFFLEQTKRRELGDEEAHQYDIDFVEAMRYGMPPCGGLGIGIDRLVMILTDNTSIKEVIPFPMINRK